MDASKASSFALLEMNKSTAETFPVMTAILSDENAYSQT